MPFGKKAEEVKEQAAAAARAREAAYKKEREAAQEADTFAASPQGRARAAFQRGDRYLQAEFKVMAQDAVVMVMSGTSNTTVAWDSTTILNAVAAEGWDLITGSFVFVVQQEQSRDKFMSSGQQVAIQGVTIGYYLFRRAEGNRSPTSLVA